MDSLFEILFIALILLAPLLESLLKKGKKKQGGGDADVGSRTSAGQPSGPETAERGPRERAGAAGTSEGLIPAEIWEELTGTRPPRTAEEEAAPREVAGEAETAWWEEGRDREAAEIAGEAVGTGEIGAAEGVRSGEIRPGEEQAPAGAVGRRQPAEVTAEEAELAARFEEAQARTAAPAASAVTGTALLGASAAGSGRARRLVAGASPRRLRDAILLTEILGPPVAMRPDGSGGAS